MFSWLGFPLGITRVTNKVIELLIEMEYLFYLTALKEILFMSKFLYRPIVGIDVAADK